VVGACTPSSPPHCAYIPENVWRAFQDFYIIIIIWKLACLIVYVVVCLYVCIPYMCRKTYWTKSVLTQVYKARILPCAERRATV
jgi:hypothetical protein